MCQFDGVISFLSLFPTMSFLSSNASISEWRSRLALSSPIVSSRASRAVSSLRGQEEVAALRSSWQCMAKFNFYAPFQITNFVLIVKGIEILNILRKSSCSLLQSRLSQVVKLLKSCENCRISFTPSLIYSFNFALSGRIFKILNRSTQKVMKS